MLPFISIPIFLWRQELWFTASVTFEILVLKYLRSTFPQEEIFISSSIKYKLNLNSSLILKGFFCNYKK